MDIDLNEEQDMLRRMSRDFLKDKCPGSFVREMMEEEKGYTPEIWKEINRFKEDSILSEMFPHRWLPNAFAIIHEPFSVENRLLTTTLKMVRRRIKDIYESLLDVLYTTEGKNYNSQNNRRVIKRLFQKHHAGD